MLTPQELRQAHFKALAGYGLMGLTWTPNPARKEKAFAAIDKAIELNEKPVLLNVGEFYGPDWANLRLAREYFASRPGAREKVIISCKGCIDFKTFTPKGDRAGVIESVENCVREFGGPIDIFEPARLDVKLAGSKPYPEETFDTLVELIGKGLIGAISLSEVNAEQIRAIDDKYHDYITCVEVELSLFSPHILSDGVADACNERGLPILCYSPLCRGFLTGSVSAAQEMQDGDFRKGLKKFSGEAFEHNLRLPKFLQEEIVNKRQDNATLPQVALAWIVSLNAKYPGTRFIPLPGGSSASRVEENFAFKQLTEQELAKINAFVKEFEVIGDRYEHA
ncbi:LAME_0C04918g1_1 [Lachancea meyersii CBS 8951]|uniref:LAME_0C04918g1_1 n=1 Tax=Lachancea meyersii CBS 8951 TaxID=1266667 RepID=A0A1G4J1Z7_9SACH|nr:LAME_0C04918g1_1 [Lachancea meyersii CBS 8951]